MQQAVTFTYALNNQGEYRLVARFQGKPSAKFGNVGLWPYRQVPRRILAGQTHLGLAPKLSAIPTVDDWESRFALSIGWRATGCYEPNPWGTPRTSLRDGARSSQPLDSLPCPAEARAEGHALLELVSEKTGRPSRHDPARHVDHRPRRGSILHRLRNGADQRGERRIWISPLWLGDEQGIGERLPTSDAEGRKKLAKNSSK